MDRSRLPPPFKRMTRHSPRKHTCGRCGRCYMYAFISLLLFCTLAIFHSKLGASSSANTSHFFTSQREKTASKISYASLLSVNLKNEPLSGDVAEATVLDSSAGNGSLPLAQDEDEDEDEAIEVQEDDNVEEEEEEEEQELGQEQEDEEEEEEEEEKDDDGEDGASLKKDRRKLKDEKLLNSVLNSSTRASVKTVLSSTNLLSSRNDGNALAGSVPDGEHMQAGTQVKKSLAGSVPDGERTQVGTQVKKSLLKLGGIKTIPRWDPLESMGGRHKADFAKRDGNTWRSIRQLFDKNENPRWQDVKWDHLLGVVRKVKSSTALFPSRKVDPGAQHSIHVNILVNQSGSSSSLTTQSFGSDDHPSDRSVIDKLEEVTSIEDALLLKGRNAFSHLWAERKPNKGDALKKDRSNKPIIDPLNPINNPLLQDPDTFGSTGLSGSDKILLKALRRGVTNVALKKQESEWRNADSTPLQKELDDSLGANKNGTSTHENVIDAGAKQGTAAERSILELSSSDSFLPSEEVEEHGISDSLLSKKSSPELDSSKGRRRSYFDMRRWGFYPMLSPDLAFSEFMDQFLGDKSCSHNVFMVWTTPPWTYTVRYQRGLESLLYFHPKVCIVVFSESIELDFFKSFVDDGFRVAVVVPNLEELLDGTPAAIFASFWLSWRKTYYFYIHYSELLRLAALYKYGGVYIDADVILLKPLGLLHNTIGAETVGNQTQRLNGAVMAFDKSSLFLQECLEEFVATYDDQFLDFNGAELVTRVAKRLTEQQNRSNELGIGYLYVEQPDAFFPLSSEHIIRYFKAPDGKQKQLETDLLFGSLYNRSSMLHLWNQKTHRLVPESNSLVERIINRHCIKCYDYL